MDVVCCDANCSCRRVSDFGVMYTLCIDVVASTFRSSHSIIQACKYETSKH